MKKLIYAIAIVITTAMSFSSCTEEEVKPNNDAIAGGGGPQDPL